MKVIQQTLRPGVYTDYTMTPIYAPNKGRVMGLLAKATTQIQQLHRITSLFQAQQIFQKELSSSPMMQMITAIYHTDCPVVLVWGIEQQNSTEQDYVKGLEKLLEEGASVIVSDALELNIIKKATQLIQKTRSIGVFSMPIDNTHLSPVQKANQINCPRICLTMPQVTPLNEKTMDLSAVLVATALASTTDPDHNLSGESFGKNYSIEDRLDNSQVEHYLKEGITILEQNGEIVEVVRGMTTATKTLDGREDVTYRNVSVILIQDMVISELQEMLEQKLHHARNNVTGLDSILSLIICKLDDFMMTGFISAYDTPTVFLDPEESTSCIVQVEFTITQGIHIIHLTAHISV